MKRTVSKTCTEPKNTQTNFDDISTDTKYNYTIFKNLIEKKKLKIICLKNSHWYDC